MLWLAARTLLSNCTVVEVKNNINAASQRAHENSCHHSGRCVVRVQIRACAAARAYDVFVFVLAIRIRPSQMHVSNTGDPNSSF